MFVYHLASATVSANYLTSATPDTEIDVAFVKPGTRNIGLLELIVGGKANGLTAITGISYRIAKWPTTSSSAGTSMAGTQRDPGAQNIKSTSGAGTGGGVNAVTSGTGTKVYVGGCMSGAGGPGGWTAANDDAMPKLEGGANQSLDLHSASHLASMNYEFAFGIVE